MYELGFTSQANLVGVQAPLVEAVKYAIAITTQDFAVTQGLRTVAAEADAVASGHSKTMHSRHLTGHAVDLVPIVNGKLSWEWPFFYPIVTAMQAAGKYLSVEMNWGADWDMELQQFTDPQAAEAEYIVRERLKGKQHPLLDGPHFQLTWADYPAP